MKAVVLAAGRGSRMQSEDGSVRLSPEQAAFADRGLKYLIPLGAPFLEHCLRSLVQAGVDDFCFIVAPGASDIREFAENWSGPPIAFAVQEEPLGTAHALLGAEAWVGGEDFLVANADNRYPASALRRLVEAGGSAVLAMLRPVTGRLPDSNLTLDRISSFAVLSMDSKEPERVIGFAEKIPRIEFDRLPDPVLVSLNCWRLHSAFFDVCREVERSPRGEYELPAAAQLAVDGGLRLRALLCHDGVLDLSTRKDIPLVASLLEAEAS